MDNQQCVLSFDGKDDYVMTPLNIEMVINFSQGFTVEAWVLYHSFPNRSVIISFVHPLDGYQYFQLMNSQTTRKLEMQCCQGDNKGNFSTYSVISEEVIETGVWMHIAATVNNSNHVTLYKNGEVVKTGSLAPPPPLSGKWNHFYVGHGMHSGDGVFQGCITEARVWNVVRSVDEIRAHKNRRLNGDETGLVSYWPLNEISGNTVVNKTCNSHHGIIYGGATIVEANPPLPWTPKTYLIKSKLNGLALVGTPYYPATTGAVDSNNPIQRWTITADGVIKNEAGFVLDYQDCNAPPYYIVMANPIQGTQGSLSQQWRLENGVIKNKHKADLVLDIAGCNPAPNTTILAAPGMGGLNQQWEIVSV